MRTNEWVGKRQAARQPVNMRGEIRFLDGRAPLDVRITDISASGCAIEKRDDVQVPEDFDLFIESRGETKICKIRRDGGAKLGVAFLKSRLDDPLVMQTLMERVSRLERGFAELKGAPGPAATGERRAATEARRADDRDAAVAGPSLDQRIQALAAGLADLRGVVDTCLVAPAAAPMDELTAGVASHARELSALRENMNDLARALRATTSAKTSAPADHAPDIARLKGEMTELSVAMRSIAASPALAQPRATAVAPPTEGRDIARVRAELAELRADQRSLRESVAAKPSTKPDETPVFAEQAMAITRLQADITELGAAMRALDAPTNGNSNIAVLRVDLAELRADMRAIRDTTARAPAKTLASADQATTIAQIKADMTNLGAAMEALASSNDENQDLARVRAELASVRGDLRDIRETVAASWAASHHPPAAAPQTDEDARASDIEDLRDAMKGLIVLVARALNPGEPAPANQAAA